MQIISVSIAKIFFFQVTLIKFTSKNMNLSTTSWQSSFEESLSHFLNHYYY